MIHFVYSFFKFSALLQSERRSKTRICTFHTTAAITVTIFMPNELYNVKYNVICELCQKDDEFFNCTGYGEVIGWKKGNNA